MLRFNAKKIYEPDTISAKLELYSDQLDVVEEDANGQLTCCLKLW